MSDLRDQPDLFQEATNRDLALDRLETHRAPIVSVARSIAFEINQALGRVTSPEVLRELARRGYDTSCDRRFMGAVFRQGSGWVRIGWEPTGSHCRPVAVWTRRGAAAT